MHNADTNITWHAGSVSRGDREAVLGQRGVVLWMTGLSGSGKSTIGSIIEAKLVAAGRAVYRLDGDNVRFGLNKSPKDLRESAGYDDAAAQRFGVAFGAADRTENIRRIGEVAKLMADAGLIVVASFISPYRRDRDAVRANLPAGDFVEVYVQASLAAAEGRDPKGLYKKARAGEIKGFTGIDDPYEPPAAAEILLDTEVLLPDAAADAVLEYLQDRGYYRP